MTAAEPAERRSAFTRERFADIEPHFADELVEDTFPARGVAVIYGPSGAGKTFLATEIVGRVGRGEEVCGRYTNQAGVVYVAAEDADGVRRRLKAWKIRNGDHGALQLIPQAPDLRNPESLADLRLTLREAALEFDADDTPLGLVVIDTLARATPGADQNSSGDMSVAIGALAQLSVELGALIVIIAHTGKDEGRGIAGWYGQYAAADAVLMVTGEKGGDPRVATLEKAKNGAIGGKFAFRLDPVKIGVNARGKPITSCVVAFEAPPTRKATKSAKLSPAETLALNAIFHVANDDDAPLAPPLPGVRPGTRAGTVAAVKAYAYTKGFAFDEEPRNTTNQRWGRSIQKLVATERARQEGDQIWPIGASSAPN